MNRILEIIKNSRGKKYLAQGIPRTLGQAPSNRPQNAPKRCSFCGRSIRDAPFVAWSLPRDVPELAAMCPRCIESSATLVQFTKSFAIRYRPIPDYEPLRRKLMKRLSCEDGSAELKIAIVDLGIRFLQRSSAILADCPFDKCDKTGTNLVLPRIAIISDELNACAELLRVVCFEIGLPFRHTTMRQLKSGFAYRELVDEQCSGQELWAAHAVLHCSGYAAPNASSVVVIAAPTSLGIPDEVEKILIDGRKTQ